LAVFATGFKVGINRVGIIDKTKMYEADSRMGWHNFSLWVLYFDLVLENIRQLPG
jgi:hypothetical protein